MHPLGKDGNKFKVTQNFNTPTNYIAGRKTHEALDIAAPKRTPVYAVFNGIVSQAYLSTGWGNAVRLQNGPRASFYAHMDEYVVKPNQAVKEGDLIGYVGSTGNSTGNHLHWEMYNGNTRYDPMEFLKGDEVTQDQIDYWKAYGFWQMFYAQTPPSEQEVLDQVYHMRGIKQAQGVDENTAWHQIYLETKLT